MLDANARLLHAREPDPAERESVTARSSLEIDRFTRRFLDEGWTCYWYVLRDEDIDPLVLRDVYEVTTGRRVDLPLDRLNAEVDVILARTLGPVESRRDLLSSYFARLEADFSGIAINDPHTARYGLRKDYLFELSRAGFPTIPTDYYPTSVTYAELAGRYGDALGGHIIKPVTGELSNSFACLADVDEQTLRWKEPKVGGWLVQPAAAEIWDGEYQLFFVGDRCANACRKVYLRDAEDAVVPVQEHRRFELYQPNSREIDLALAIRDFLRDQLGLRNDIFRMDFLKAADGAPILLEFEMVNPGSFIRYLDDDAARDAIADALVEYLVRRLGERARPAAPTLVSP
jgi:hypothetical protein